MPKSSTVTVLTAAQCDELLGDVTLLTQATPAAPQAGLTVAQLAIINSTATKSTKIRSLLAAGMTRGAVAKALNIRYQHVRNVELTPLKKG